MENREELKRDRNEPGGAGPWEKRYRYCVLYTQVLKQWEVYEVIRKALPEGRGTVFYPCVELWWNDTVDTVIRPLFPGYVFIRSDLGRAELHDLIVRRRWEILSFVKELKLAEQKSAGGVPGDMDDSLLIDLSDEEAEFLDFMLNFKYEEPGEGPAGKASGGEEAHAEGSPGEKASGGEAHAEGGPGEKNSGGEEAHAEAGPGEKASGGEAHAEGGPGEKASGGEETHAGSNPGDKVSGEKTPVGSSLTGKPAGLQGTIVGRRKAGRVPREGVLQMSYGYCENGKCVVMEGPLKGYEERIVRVDRRKKKAYLDLEINGHMAKAGLVLLGKGYWFPKDKYASSVLEDGTEIDPAEIARRMMSGGE